MYNAILIAAAVVVIILLVGSTIVGPKLADRHYARRDERNHQAHQYRMDLLAQISRAATVDAIRDRPYEWRFDVFHTVRYKDLVNSRRPFDSFYPDKSFLDPEATGPKTEQAEPAD